MSSAAPFSHHTLVGNWFESRLDPNPFLAPSPELNRTGAFAEVPVKLKHIQSDPLDYVSTSHLSHLPIDLPKQDDGAKLLSIDNLNFTLGELQQRNLDAFSNTKPWHPILNNLPETKSSLVTPLSSNSSIDSSQHYHTTSHSTHGGKYAQHPALRKDFGTAAIAEQRAGASTQILDKKNTGIQTGMGNVSELVRLSTGRLVDRANFPAHERDVDASSHTLVQRSWVGHDLQLQHIRSRLESEAGVAPSQIVNPEGVALKGLGENSHTKKEYYGRKVYFDKHKKQSGIWAE